MSDGRMAGRAEGTEVTGVVAALLPRGLIRVVVDGTNDVVAHVADDPLKNFVRLVVGDRVRVELTAQDPSRGRITRRLRS